ncbi:thiamine pyrophosphate-dependent enzyme [Aestuariibaculum sediminum]|uniref:4Fe-4S binding protein n=1 Tax=Aestuariibaculum sediminum TaxID=2770637 RepID=A0A8J6U7E9_9FLAO|nr:thiamine pyrophosphate-dependent enzyme [Aestuariibaculum sediminum]MBD0831795.1 4Fe-4S binding protein [Aestuariibaculum sediminum]
METSSYSILNANQAVAHIAYQTNEVMPIYPITPASEMSELVEQWAAQNITNCFGSTPQVYQMQSESGVAGAMHGAITTGALSTTFTASQGLLLMLPNMYKIAGELTPNVIHVATRSIATHALSVFGDHSDVMAVRQSGYAMLSSASVQEAQDFALIAQAASLQSRIPFLHFFDGFRTSHEITKIESISNNVIQQMINLDAIQEHRNKALNPNRPVIKGTSQAPDIFFQSREAINSIYNACPNIVQDVMTKFKELTGRSYRLFEYTGNPNAEHIIISMASSTQTIEETIAYLNNKQEKFGLIKVKLYRPFSNEHLLKALPKTCKSIAVLDRTKEPGSNGEPLFLDVSQALLEAYQNNKINHLPKITRGRYGLSGKSFTPDMVYAIFENLKNPDYKPQFTVGINDDLTHLNLDIKNNMHHSSAYQAVFYETKNKTLNKSLTTIIKEIGKTPSKFIQGYTTIDYKKSNTRATTHIRIDKQPIKSAYLINNANFIAANSTSFVENDTVLETIKRGGTLLINTIKSPSLLWKSLSVKSQEMIQNKKIKVLVVDCHSIPKAINISSYNISSLHACFLAHTRQVLKPIDIQSINAIINTVDTSEINSTEETVNGFNNTIIGKIMANKGDDLTVSQMPVDGTYPTNTSEFNIIESSEYIPHWDLNLCSQCGACSMACPQAALRIKVYNDEKLIDAPIHFKSTKAIDPDWKKENLNYTIEINPNQCNGCFNCVDACADKALSMVYKNENTSSENWRFFEEIPELDRNKINLKKVSQQQLQEPLFKYSMGVKGCGEAPYLKLLSQLFGDRLLVANATGASSIFGGALPTTPWSKNANERGPAWANSLFEDNAEFGLGYRLSIDQQLLQAQYLLKELSHDLPLNMVYAILNAKQNNDAEINAQRIRVEKIKSYLKVIKTEKHSQLYYLMDAFVKKSIWIVGGDGWAYDIGYSGIDHVLASGKNVNILVLDNEVYDNTGGQASKATPFGAQAKFTSLGKRNHKKDLGLIAMQYDNVYVASVAIGANQEQTLKAFVEAESFNGPSIIIAYCHSDSHGIDMQQPSQYHKAAVNSGQWILYRNDPRKQTNDKTSFQLDSAPPSISIGNYLSVESRFSNLINAQENFNTYTLDNYQNHINNKFTAFAYKENLNHLKNNLLSYV